MKLGFNNVDKELRFTFNTVTGELTRGLKGGDKYKYLWRNELIDFYLYSDLRIEDGFLYMPYKKLALDSENLEAREIYSSYMYIDLRSPEVIYWAKDVNHPINTKRSFITREYAWDFPTIEGRLIDLLLEYYLTNVEKQYQPSEHLVDRLSRTGSTNIWFLLRLIQEPKLAWILNETDRLHGDLLYVSGDWGMDFSGNNVSEILGLPISQARYYMKWADNYNVTLRRMQRISKVGDIVLYLYSTLESVPRAYQCEDLLARASLRYLGTCLYRLDKEHLDTQDLVIRRMVNSIKRLGIKDTCDYMILMSDILKAQKGLGFPIEIPRNHDEAVEVHNQIVPRYKARLEEKGDAMSTKRMLGLAKDYEYLDFTIERNGDTYKAIVPGSAEELYREGQEQHNCVATYRSRFISGYCVLVFIKKNGQSFITVELNREANMIMQAREKYNKSVQPENQWLLDELKNRF